MKLKNIIKTIIYIVVNLFDVWLLCEMIKYNLNVWLIIGMVIILFLVFSIPLLLKMCKFLSDVNGGE